MRWLKKFFSNCSRISRTRGNSRSRPFRPVLERLENRLAPSVTRTLGTQEITVVEEPVTTWSSDSSVARTESNKVPENDAIIATQGVTYGFTERELSASRSDAGYTLVQFLSWREDDLISDHVVASTTATKTIKPGTDNTIIYAPKVFQTTVGDWTGFAEGDTIEFKVRVHTGFWEANLDSEQIWLTEGSLQGGAQTPSREGTQGVGYASEYFHTWWAPSPGGVGNFQVYTFESPDGNDFEVKGFNDTGYTLLKASGDRLVENEEEKLEFDPSVTFEPVYSEGSGAIGDWNGAGSVWAIEDDQGSIGYFTGFSYSELPSALASISDGGSGTVVGGESLQAGNQALWLFFETPDETVGFLIVNNAPVTAASTTTTLSSSQNPSDHFGSVTFTATVTREGGTLLPTGTVIFKDGDTILMSSQLIDGQATFTTSALSVGTHTITAEYNGDINHTESMSDPVTQTVLNNAPVAFDNSYTLDEDPTTALQGNVLTDPDGESNIDDDIDGDALTATLVDGPSSAAAFTLNADGSFSYTPAPDWYGTDTFTYQANDGLDDSNVATVTITVNPVNDAPILDVIGNQSVNEGTELSFTATASDPDIPANSLTFSLEGDVPDGASIDPQSGVFSWTPTAEQGPGTYVFTVRVTDDGTGTLFDEEEITVTVTVNDPPAGTITGRAWEDLDEDGIQETGEEGLANILVSLYDANDNLIDSYLTNSNGLYEFSVAAGSGYYVRFEALELGEHLFGPKDQEGDDTVDSDVNEFGFSDPFEVFPGQSVQHVDAAYILLGGGG